MLSCRQCEGIERQFAAPTARRDLRRYRRRGPLRTTRLLIEALREQGIDGASLLDIGGGVGAVHHELLAHGAREVVQVEISPAYLAAATEESARRGTAERVRFVRGDFVELAPGLEPADVVTLDRVICCYPDMSRLVALSADKTRRLYGAVYPRRVWWVRVALAAGNALLRVLRSSFRVYAHPPEEIERVLRERGLEPRTARRTFVWHVAVFVRRSTPPV